MNGPATALSLVVLAAVSLATAGCGRGGESGKPGKELFLIHCSGCHPDGGNLKYPQKSLDRMTLAANGITTPEQIVHLMRHPGRGMKAFDRATVSDGDARKVAEYILATFR